MGQKTVYYYYMVVAKALQALGEPTIVDAKGAATTGAKSWDENCWSCSIRKVSGQPGGMTKCRTTRCWSQPSP
jgi:hypothetical protein